MTMKGVSSSEVALGRLVINVLAIGPKVCGFKPGRERWLFKDDKVHSTTSLEGEVKPSVPCSKILRHVKNSCGV
jgi:hypothetical protein